MFFLYQNLINRNLFRNIINNFVDHIQSDTIVFVLIFRTFAGMH